MVKEKHEIKKKMEVVDVCNSQFGTKISCIYISILDNSTRTCDNNHIVFTNFMYIYLYISLYINIHIDYFHFIALRQRLQSQIVFRIVLSWNATREIRFYFISSWQGPEISYALCTLDFFCFFFFTRPSETEESDDWSLRSLFFHQFKLINNGVCPFESDRQNLKNISLRMFILKW